MDGVTFVNETPYVLSLAGVESVDPNTGAQRARCNVELDNATRRYDPDNAADPSTATGPHLGRRPTSASVQRIHREDRHPSGSTP